MGANAKRLVAVARKVGSIAREVCALAGCECSGRNVLPRPALGNTVHSRHARGGDCIRKGSERNKQKRKETVSTLPLAPPRACETPRCHHTRPEGLGNPTRASLVIKDEICCICYGSVTLMFFNAAHAHFFWYITSLNIG
jgi:hypothetical protein